MLLLRKHRFSSGMNRNGNHLSIITITQTQTEVFVEGFDSLYHAVGANESRMLFDKQS